MGLQYWAVYYTQSIVIMYVWESKKPVMPPVVNTYTHCTTGIYMPYIAYTPDNMAQDSTVLSILS